MHDLLAEEVLTEDCGWRRIAFRRPRPPETVVSARCRSAIEPALPLVDAPLHLVQQARRHSHAQLGHRYAGAVEAVQTVADAARLARPAVEIDDNHPARSL